MLQMMKVMCETEQEYYLQHMVHQKLQGYNMPQPRSKGNVLVELATELRHLKDEVTMATMSFMGELVGILCCGVVAILKGLGFFFAHFYPEQCNSVE